MRVVTAVRLKQLLLGLLSVLALGVVLATTYFTVRPQPQQTTSRAGSSCNSVVKVELAGSRTVQVGGKIYPQVFAYLNNEPLGMAAVTIDYDPDLVELDRGLVEQVGDDKGGLLIGSSRYDHDPNLDPETSAIFELPKARKLHVLASCKYIRTGDGKIRCSSDQSVWGDYLGSGRRRVLLATLPLVVKGVGKINLGFQNVECGSESTESVVLGASTGLELSGDTLRSASGLEFCGMDINLDGSVDADGKPTVTVLDFRRWLVYFREYMLGGNFTAKADFNCDGRINALDFSVFMREFRRWL